VFTSNTPCSTSLPACEGAILPKYFSNSTFELFGYSAIKCTIFLLKWSNDGISTSRTSYTRDKWQLDKPPSPVYIKLPPLIATPCVNACTALADKAPKLIADTPIIPFTENGCSLSGPMTIASLSVTCQGFNVTKSRFSLRLTNVSFNN